MTIRAMWEQFVIAFAYKPPLVASARRRWRLSSHNHTVCSITRSPPAHRPTTDAALPAARPFAPLKPTAKEPSKKSTFGKLYDNSPYFMDRRLEGKVASAFTSELGNTLGKEDSRLTWTGRLSPSTYVGNGTFQLANGEI